MLAAVAHVSVPEHACGAALGPVALLAIGLAKLLTQAGGDIGLAVDDARGGIAGSDGQFSRVLVEIAGIEHPIDAMGPDGRLRALFALWAEGRASFPLLAAVLADRGCHWRALKSSLITDPWAVGPQAPTGVC
ncbi:hypothetical protein LMG32289_05383 [Cupriavidus pampae]|jgi:hypothetical protein|uniref:Uncharacterized protein n=1 Tax=Cupriavidus pampae TaxID=659251 RepID=A0ABM8XTJ1_9BURK|nr:hypothetical protein LMG32289_05383 [Cupriavidus pampae]